MMAGLPVPVFDRVVNVLPTSSTRNDAKIFEHNAQFARRPLARLFFIDDLLFRGTSFGQEILSTIKRAMQERRGRIASAMEKSAFYRTNREKGFLRAAIRAHVGSRTLIDNERPLWQFISSRIAEAMRCRAYFERSFERVLAACWEQAILLEMRLSA